MLTKRACVLGIFLFLPLLLTAQAATVAVLDTILQDGDIPQNASPVAASYLNDSFSASSRYIPLDRRLLYTSWFGISPGSINIVSLVQRGEYGKLAELLEADFLCLSTLERSGGGYLLTAELFDASQGGVTARETARADRIVELPEAARLAGINLSGASPSALPRTAAPLLAARPAEPPREEPAPAAESPADEPEPAAPSAEEPQEQSRNEGGAGGSGKAVPFGSMTLSYLIPGFVGNEEFYVNSVKTPLYDAGVGEEFDWGMDFNLRITGSSFFCFDLGFTVASQLLTYDAYDYYTGSYGEETSMSFGFFDLYLGLGGVLPLSEKFQLAGVGTLGYGILLLGSEIWSSETIAAYDESSGLTLGITAGMDFRPFGDFVLTLRYKLSYASELDPLATDFGYQGLLLGLGTAF